MENNNRKFVLCFGSIYIIKRVWVEHKYIGWLSSSPVYRACMDKGDGNYSYGEYTTERQDAFNEVNRIIRKLEK